MRALFTTIAALMSMSSAAAQVPSIAEPGPRQPDGPLSPSPSPRLPVQPALERPSPMPLPLPTATQPVGPRIQLMGENRPIPAGVLRGFRVRISGLGDARALHLFQFSPGCSFTLPGGVAGLPLARDRINFAPGSPGAGYTTVVEAQTRTTRPYPQGSGLRVSNGAVEIALTGLVGLNSAAASTRAPAVEDLRRPGVLESFERTIDTDGATCVPIVVVVVQGADGNWRQMAADGSLAELDDRPPLIRGTSWDMAPHRRVTIGSTDTIRSLLQPGISGASAGSVCSGTSSAVASPDHEVGRFVKGGDIAFRIRSGPAGTRCLVSFPDIGLPAGVVAVGATFEVDRTGSKCNLNHFPFTPQDVFFLLSPGGITRRLDRVSGVLRDPVRVERAGTVRDIGINSWFDPFTFPDPGTNDRYAWQAHFIGLYATLGCDVTAVNDHGVELRLQSMDFLVPEGVQFP